jgi:hypothetical protein
MCKMARFGVALVFGLLLALTLLAPGASARSVNASQHGAALSPQQVATTATLQNTNRPAQVSKTQQTTQPLSWNGRSWHRWGGWGWGGWGWGSGWGWGGWSGCGCGWGCW